MSGLGSGLVAHCRAILTVALMAVAVAAGAETRPDRPLQHADVFDVIYFGEQRPALIRFHIQVDGAGPRQKWEATVQSYFAALDVNRDGFLNRLELARALPPQVLANASFLGGGFAAVQLDRIDSNKDSKVALGEFLRYYGQNEAACFQLRFPTKEAYWANDESPPPGRQDEALNTAIYRLVDRNGDQRLERSELAALAEAAARLDTDEDEAISFRELLRSVRQPVVQAAASAGRRVSDRSGKALCMAVESDASSGAVARQLAIAYAGGHTPIHRGQLRISSRDFEALDLDKNGLLEDAELGRFNRKIPDAEILLEMTNERYRVRVKSAHKDSGWSPTGADADMPAEFSAGFFADDANVLRLLVRSHSAPRIERGRLESTYLGFFAGSDTNKNGFLERPEVQRIGAFASSFSVMDKNGDGKLSKEELQEFAAGVAHWYGELARCTVALKVHDHGRGIFDWLDANHDGLIGVREMRNTVGVLEPLWQRYGGQLARTRMPRMIVFGLERGSGAETMPFPGFQGLSFSHSVAAGPMWFQKMDHNHDGDISPREFLGSESEFRELDQDGDGLISLAEARAADARWRRHPAGPR